MAPNPTQSNATISIAIPVSDKEKLQYLAQTTRVSQSDYVREALTDLFAKYEKAFVGSKWKTTPKKTRKRAKTKVAG